jgi:hypothetical protein
VDILRWRSEKTTVHEMTADDLIENTRAMLVSEQAGKRDKDRMFALKALGLALKTYIETGKGDIEFMQLRYEALRENREYKLT